MSMPQDEPRTPSTPPEDAGTRVLEQQPPPSPQRPPSRSLPGGPWPWLVAALLVVVAGVLLAVFLTRGGGNGSASDVSVPGVVGFSQGQAERQAQRAGLKTAVTRIQTKQAAGTVVSQSPAAGDQVAKGSQLVLTVSRGAAPQTVPKLIGLSGARAVTVLSSAGIRWKITYIPSPQPYGIVVAQVPRAGALATSGLNVLIKVSRGEATTTTQTTARPVAGTVPNVIGETLSDAVTALQNAGYIPRPRLVKSNQIPGTVISQSPAGGTKAASGSGVVIKIAGAS
jgi:eukaryotic-like serine/threonine-protein kinase